MIPVDYVTTKKNDILSPRGPYNITGPLGDRDKVSVSPRKKKYHTHEARTGVAKCMNPCKCGVPVVGATSRENATPRGCDGSPE